MSENEHDLFRLEAIDNQRDTGFATLILRRRWLPLLALTVGMAGVFALTIWVMLWSVGPVENLAQWIAARFAAFGRGGQ